jgi:hypothetical protein
MSCAGAVDLCDGLFCTRVEILTDKEIVHPADALATALDRVSSLLAVVGELYNSPTENFAGGNEFVLYAVSTASNLVVDARSALGDLHQNCDLTLVMPATLEEVVATAKVAEAASVVAAPVSVETPVEPLNWKIDSRSTSAEVPQQQPVNEQEQFAKSYLELLRKLTAAEVFATEQQALAAPGSAPELLPLLRGLREDFQKMHNTG